MIQNPPKHLPKPPKTLQVSGAEFFPKDPPNTSQTTEPSRSFSAEFLRNETQPCDPSIYSVLPSRAFRGNLSPPPNQQAPWNHNASEIRVVDVPAKNLKDGGGRETAASWLGWARFCGGWAGWTARGVGAKRPCIIMYLIEGTLRRWIEGLDVSCEKVSCEPFGLMSFDVVICISMFFPTCR